jgi:hypothetical protein
VSKNEIEIIFDILVESKKDLNYEIEIVVFGSSHKFLFMNTDSQRLFKEFDELIIPD